VGKYHIQLCGTTPCQLRGAEKLKEVCQTEIGKPMYVTDDGRLSWEEVECLGACVNAPMVQVNDDYYEDLTPDMLSIILNKLKNGVEAHPGPQVDRINSAPEGGTAILTDPDLFDGTRNQISALPNLPSSEPEPEPTAAGKPDENAPTNTQREVPQKENTGKTTLISKTEAAGSGETAEVAGEKPETITIAIEDRDDLKRIKGIGPKNEDALNELGIYTFKQIAEWTSSNVDWVEDFMSFPGRIEREDWIGQAKLLASGAETEFSKRVDAGEVASSKDDEE
jgi:NADH-quinone oxidoreductase subunit E